MDTVGVPDVITTLFLVYVHPIVIGIVAMLSWWDSIRTTIIAFQKQQTQLLSLVGSLQQKDNSKEHWRANAETKWRMATVLHLVEVVTVVRPNHP